MKIILIFFLLFFPTDCFAQPAFPGAEGGGANATGGRGGSVIHVTNLNATGAGSFRAACEASGARTVVFDVGGTIDLEQCIVLEISNPYITIAGQTAPGGGILIKGFKEFLISTHDVIIRYVRLRSGSGNWAGQNGHSALIAYGGAQDALYNIIIDHCSISWANDENLTIWANHYPAHDITVSHSIISEGTTYGHASCGLIIGSDVNSEDFLDIDMHHNFFTNNDRRSPLFKGKRSRIVNNIVYNWGSWASGLAGGTDVDIIGNLYKKGPNSGTKHEIQWRSDQCGVACGPQGVNPSIYIVGNKGPYQADPDANNWDMIRESPVWVEGGAVNVAFQRGSPLSTTHPAITVGDVDDLESELLNAVGAYRRLDKDGYWIANRGTIDARLIQEYNAGTGQIPVTEDDVGGWPTLAAGTPYIDADADGMAAAWEAYMGLDDACATDRNGDLDSDGYTNLEEFLSGDRTPPAIEGFVNQGFTFTGFTIDLGN